MQVAFQGEKGAYSENAVYAFFNTTVTTKPCTSFLEVFSVVENGETEFGVVPIENSIEGSVNQVYDLFLTHDLLVERELILKIDHCLIANHNVESKAIEVVYSHPQALAQCRTFLERVGYKLVSTYDTAGSVKMISEKKLKNAGAIASERAAKLYGMKILATEIADNPSNFTRFFLLSTHDAPPTGHDKTSIIFSLKHAPGSLFNALKGFATRRINLTKIESRPTKQKPWEYNFYLDFEGHRREKKCSDALKELEKEAFFVKLLGSYPQARNIFE